jgi:hypothetical protein
MYQNIFVNWYFLSPTYGVHPDVTKLVCMMVRILAPPVLQNWRQA